jgi:hypothetical protein
MNARAQNQIQYEWSCWRAQRTLARDLMWLFLSRYQKPALTVSENCISIPIHLNSEWKLGP